jgi:hypothetical protein
VYAENTSGLRSAPSNDVSQLVPTTPPPPSGNGLALERGTLAFGATKSGSTVNAQTPNQRLLVTQTATSAVSFTTSVPSGSTWLRVTPANGTGTTPLTVSIVATSLNPGTYNGVVRVRPAGTTTNLDVAVQARVYANGTTTGAVGFVDTPTDGATNVSGAIAVTGWAMDDVGVNRVDIYRDAVNNEPAGAQIYLGSAAFVAGSRADIETAYPNSPMNYRGGWGYMVLTNMLPDRTNGRTSGGNGAFRVHAYAVDQEGIAKFLGTKNFSANNAGASKPFGTIDTPAQGGTASGNNYMVFGWALSPHGTIPANGSTITAYVDGNPIGHPTYNNYRSDIATMFPGFANTMGAIGYIPLNTTTLSNGTHTIAWVVTDNLGNSQGIGSRFFVVQNGSAASTAASTSAAEAVDSSNLAPGSHGTEVGQSSDSVADVPPDYALVEVKKVASDDPRPQVVWPEWTGVVRVTAEETEHVEVRLANQFDEAGGTYEGYVVAGERLRPLPVGSSLNPRSGVFRWQPGPGFVGDYEFVFIRKMHGGYKTRIPVTITIAPKQQ